MRRGHGAVGWQTPATPGSGKSAGGSEGDRGVRRANDHGIARDRPAQPKVVKPITKEMEEGKEPLRSFSDLMQFYQKKQT